MGKKDKRVDVYIGAAATFAVPILDHLRSIVHKACPDVEETIKWGFPHFMHKGILCSMAAFRQHCAFGFWKATLLDDKDAILKTVGKTATGHLGQLQKMKDLPSDKILMKYLQQAMQLNEAGVKLMVKKKPVTQKALVVPDYLVKALRKNKDAQRHFEAYSYSGRKEYIDWLKEAKTEETRSKRLNTAMDWISEGKERNWKYQK